MNPTRIALAGFALAAAAVVLAGDPPRQPFALDPTIVFRRADADRNGFLSKEEFRELARRSPKLKDDLKKAEQAFAFLDGNRDGKVGLDEYRRAAPAKPGKAKADAPAAKPSPAPKNDAAPASADQIAFFERRIRPALATNCYGCHSAASGKAKGGLVLDTRAGIRKGGESGPAVVPGDPAKSVLLAAIRHEADGLQMPPTGKLPDDTLADFEKWIRGGAADPRDGQTSVAKSEIDIEKGKRFWSFQPLRSVAPPAVKDAAWATTEIDRFLLAAMDAKGVRPVDDAAPAALLRRLHFDLVGLPPTPEEVEELERDPSPAAYGKAVDALLASPRFGERWGRHWLDVARYAETTGKSVNTNLPHAWRYRDYVVAAFNVDKPYDRFVREQLAGDLMPAKDERQRAEQTIATGFLAIGPKTLNERNPTQFELDLVDEQIDVTTQAILGLTVSCARCHDHRFDPIPTRDYYALAGVFRSTETCYGTIRFVQSQRPSALLPLPKDQPAAVSKLSPIRKKLLERQVAQGQEQRKEAMKKADGGVPINLIFAQARIALAQSELDGYAADGEAKRVAMGTRDRFFAKDSPVYVRGEPDKPGEVVPRGVLQVLTASPVAIRRGSGRRELAEWLVGGENPLPARVMANRVWLHLFGRGIVPTPDNFGASGQPPSHPELLDHLATSFQKDGWSVKRLIRSVVMTRAYRLAATHDARNHETDPDNVLVWRAPPRRLEAEPLRDSMLAVAGNIDAKPPVGSAIARNGEGPVANRLRPVQLYDAHDRHRSVYLAIPRDMVPEPLALFDFAEPSLVVGERATTTVPAQSLYMMNAPFVREQSDAVAGRLLAREDSDDGRIRYAYRLFYARAATDAEIRAAREFLDAYGQSLAADRVASERVRRSAWAALCQAFFASAEFAQRG